MGLSRLKPDSATMVGLLTAAGVFLIYENATPTLADVRVAPEHDNDVETARRHAAWMSAGLVGVTFLVARDLNSYIISGAALVALDAMYKHANATNPLTGAIDSDVAGDSIMPGTVYPMAEYAEESA